MLSTIIPTIWIKTYKEKKLCKKVFKTFSNTSLIAFRTQWHTSNYLCMHVYMYMCVYVWVYDDIGFFGACLCLVFYLTLFCTFQHNCFLLVCALEHLNICSLCFLPAFEWVTGVNVTHMGSGRQKLHTGAILVYHVGKCANYSRTSFTSIKTNREIIIYFSKKIVYEIWIVFICVLSQLVFD